MSKRSELGEIATVLTLGTLLFIGVASLISNSFLKKPQSTSTKAAVSCNDSLWVCADECAPDSARYAYKGMNNQNNSAAAAAWRKDKAQNCGLAVSQCSLTDKCEPIGEPTIPPSSVGVTCDSDAWSCGGECARQQTRDMFGDALKWRQEKAKNCGFSSVSECLTRKDCGEGVGSPSSTPAPGAPTATPVPGSSGGKCACKDGKASDATLCGDTNPCGPDIGACTVYGEWKNECTGSAQNCPADAGVTYTSWCDGEKWRFQYPNCVTWCKPDYINKPPSTTVAACKDKSPGTSIDPASAGTMPSGIVAGSTVTGLDAKLYYSCDGNQGVYVNIAPFCDQFGQIQWGPKQKTTTFCVPPDMSVTKAPGSFTLNLNVYVNKTANGFDFTNEAKVYSNDCDGDLRFSRDGAFVNITGWNRKVKGDTFTWPKEHLGNISIAAGESNNYVFEAALLNCPRSKTPITDTVTCNFGVSPYGIPWVRGAGCALANFADVQKITPLPTPKTKPQVTWAPPPALKTTPIIFNGKAPIGSCTNDVCQDYTTPGGVLQKSLFKCENGALRFSQVCSSGCSADGKSCAGAAGGLGTTSCSPFHGNKIVCQANNCDYFENRSLPGGITLVCNQCVPKGTTVEIACPNVPVGITPKENACPNDGLNSKCVTQIPFVEISGWTRCPADFTVTSNLACRNWGEVCCVRDAAAAIIAPPPTIITKRVVVDDLDSTVKWVTNVHACEYIGKGLVVPFSLNLRNCKSLVYGTDAATGKKYYDITFNAGQKMAMCNFGGWGHCIFIN